ncbi:hypothetical protein ACVWWW_003073, partial [Lysobacter sp. HA18]
ALGDDASWKDFIATIRAKGRGRIDLVARVDLPDGRPATTFDARFAAIVRAPGG